MGDMAPRPCARVGPVEEELFAGCPSLAVELSPLTAMLRTRDSSDDSEPVLEECRTKLSCGRRRLLVLADSNTALARVSSVLRPFHLEA